MNTRNEAVLIIDSDAGVRKYLRKLLSTEGYTMVEAADEADALAACAATTRLVALAVIDASLSGADALALGARIKALRPGVRLVYTSVYLGEGSRLRGEFFIEREMAPLAFLEDIAGAMARSAGNSAVAE